MGGTVEAFAIIFAIGADAVAATGEVLWSFFAGAGVNAPPVSYAVMASSA